MKSRQSLSQQVRNEAAAFAASKGPVRHVANGEEFEYRNATEGVKDTPSHIANFTKGLPHDDETGLLRNHVDYIQFIRGIDSGEPADFLATPLGPAATQQSEIDGCLTRPAITCDLPPAEADWLSHVAKKGTFGETSEPKPVGLRAWESAGAGLTFDLEGPDAQAVTMPPAPRFDSAELAGEMVEVYAQALLRDTHFSQFRDFKDELRFDVSQPQPRSTTGFSVEDAITQLRLQSEWFGAAGNSEIVAGLTDAERSRLRAAPNKQTVFRGITPGDDVGPYLSQFLLIGNSGINSVNQEREISDGLITYGAIRVDQRVRIATPTVDYMTTFNEYVDVQNGARLNGLESYLEPEGDQTGYRFITTPRDLATYVHYDALYEAYLNACLLLIGLEVPFDRGLPFHRNDIADHQTAFAHFGGPHILTLVCEVATRALKAVRYQKFNVHRRLRPEALAARLAKFPKFQGGKYDTRARAFEPVRPLFDRLSRAPDHGKSILDWVKDHNWRQGEHTCETREDPPLALLPMAFAEGSPMHPAYGAGHATVAGACTTILKAFFDVGTQLWEMVKEGDTEIPRPICYEPNADGSALVSLLGEGGGRVESYGGKGGVQASRQSTPLESYRASKDQSSKEPKDWGFKPLTVEGELNKLAANISIGRDWAGVHYFTDYIESLRMGEQIALQILEEQKLTYGENFSMTVPLFDGGSVRI